MNNKETENKKLMDEIINEIKYFSDELKTISINTLSEAEFFELTEICDKVKYDMVLLENLSNIASTLNLSFKDEAINQLKLSTNKNLEIIDKKLLDAQIENQSTKNQFTQV